VLAGARVPADDDSPIVPTVLPLFDVVNNRRTAIDFSRAGIQQLDAAHALWDRAEVVLEAPPGGDSTGVIQQALDDLGEAGGGTVRLGPGIWPLRAEGLRLRHSGVRLMGAGVGVTRLSVTDTYTRRQTTLLIGSASPATWLGSHGYPDSWPRQGEGVPVEPLTIDAPAGEPLVRVANPSLAQPGDLVIVTANATAAFIADHNMTGIWTSQMDHPTVMRRVEVRYPYGYRLDMPIPYPMRTRDGVRIFPARSVVQHVGLMGFSLDHAPNPASDFESGVGAFETAQATAIKVVNASDVLIEDIHMPMVPSRGVEVAYARHVTVRRVRIDGSQNINGEWNGYHFFVWGCDNLFEQCEAAGGRRGFSILMAMSSGNVIHRCRSVSPRLFSDFHMHLSQRNLVDTFEGVGDAWVAQFRNTGTPIPHGISGTENVFWNITSDQPVVVRSAQHGRGWVVGTQGAGGVARESEVYFAAPPLDHVEAVGQGHRLQPASLFEYQRAWRATLVNHGIIVR
jgi:hypothetical protein